jgi:hypothetical protein
MDHLPAGVTRAGDETNAKVSVPVPKPFKVDLPRHCTWTNEATQLELTTYFDPNKPNLSNDFGINGLQPVIRDTESDVFLLQDGSGNFYQWSSWGGEMWRLEDCTKVQEAVQAIMRDSGILKKAPVWNFSRLERH